MASDVIRYATLTELRRLLLRREATAVELAHSTMRLLDTVGRELSAVANLAEGRARHEAEAADRALRAGRTHPLTGIPWAPKDLLATAGVPTEWGAPPFVGQMFDEDATVVRRLSDAGAVLVGKLAMVEMAGAGLYRYATASTQGACRNPWDTSRWAGGSSSGSAAAVAAGLTPYSIGSETGGSLVIPAAFCGVTALRPSAGTVSRHGALFVAWSLDKLGPIARSVDDVATVFAAIAGRDDRDAGTTAYRFRRTRRSSFRLGVLSQSSDDPAVNAAFHAAVGVLDAAGCATRPVALPDIDFRELHDRLVGGETAAVHEDFIRGPALGELVDAAQQEALLEYLDRSPAEYPRAMAERAAATRAVDATLDDVDALLAPTVLTEAVPLDVDLLAYRKRRRGGNMFLGSVAGVPELTVPMGVGSAGLPVGLSIIGRRLDDATVLRIGQLFQQSTAWHARRPPSHQPAAA